MPVRTVVTGTGHCVPPRVVTNKDLEKLMDTTDEWIRERSGILERHHVDAGVGTSDLAAEAARRAIADAGIDPATIDFIVAATLSPDHYFPGIGVLVQAKLGLGPIGALDVRDQCSGFLYALSAADQYIKAGTYKRILLVAAEVQSTNLDFSDRGRDMSVLFGDGAGAVILEPHAADDGRGILSTHLYADGNCVSQLWMEKPSSKDSPTFQPPFFEEGRFFPKMDGRTVFVNACQRMPEAVRTALTANGLTIDAVDHLIPHQANDRISLMVAKGLKIPVEKVIRNIDRLGNTTAASIPIALDEAVKAGRIKRGDLVALTAFGSGFTWASALVRW
ncbi:MAG: ketoacyl-ACP synthase III [Candidatus Aminicenantes bacterium]|nr:ketoacyl-ACP synthase III [Candidatus Aminicenantes bacterium]NLH77765.1 ketoacyl-ACP synthase III [Acidobacteriota bacterium]